MDHLSENLIYVYGVVGTKPHPGDLGKWPFSLYSLHGQGTHAIVQKVSAQEFREESLKKRLTDMTWVEERVRRHEGILEDVMQKTSVVPFKFPAIFENEENVIKFLSQQKEEFKRMIRYLQGKEEWGLKVYCDLEKLRESLEGDDPRIRKIDSEMADAGKGRAFFLRKKKIDLVTNIMDEEIAAYTKDSFERLSRFCVESRINKILPRELTRKFGDMVLNAAFLVKKKRIGGFFQILEYLKSKYTAKGISFDVTGPWPAYNFCSIDPLNNHAGKDS